jgi:hypothetical protein
MQYRLLISAGTLAGLSLFSLQAMAVEVPKRKPGHWQITTVAPGTGMTTVDACIGEDDNIATPSESGDCSEPTVTEAGSEVIVNVVCKRSYGKQIMSTAFGGDFNSRYHGIMKMTFDPPEGVKNMGVTIDGKYIGPDCPPAAAAPAPG